MHELRHGHLTRIRPAGRSSQRGRMRRRAAGAADLRIREREGRGEEVAALLLLLLRRADCPVPAAGRFCCCPACVSPPPLLAARARRRSIPPLGMAGRPAAPLLCSPRAAAPPCATADGGARGGGAASELRQRRVGTGAAGVRRTTRTGGAVATRLMARDARTEPTRVRSVPQNLTGGGNPHLERISSPGAAPLPSPLIQTNQKWVGSNQVGSAHSTKHTVR